MYASNPVLSEPPSLLPNPKSSAPVYLVPPCMEHADGTGPAVAVKRGKLLVITVGVNHVVEKESLTLSIWGSANGKDWGATPLIVLPQKSYGGIYSTFLDLAKFPDVRYLHAQWNMLRWDHGDTPTLFGFYVSVQETTSSNN